MWRSSLISNIAFHNGKLLIKIALLHVQGCQVVKPLYASIEKVSSLKIPDF